MKNELKKYIKENLKKNKNLFSKLKNFFIAEYVEIETFLNQYENKNSFQKLLFKLINDRQLTDPEVYNKVHIDRRQFSKIRCDDKYHPSKETVILLGLALELTIEELEELLESASYSLPKNNHYDLIIRFCFINKIYKLTEVNELLNEYKCKLFNY